MAGDRAVNEVAMAGVCVVSEVAMAGGCVVREVAMACWLSCQGGSDGLLVVLSGR